MHDSSRLGATLIIWSALTVMFGIIGAILVTTNAEIDFWGGVFLLILIATLTEAAAKGTKAVWRAAPGQDADDSARALAKAKRTRLDRLERLVDSLDDDEIYDLEALLLAEHEGQRVHS